MDDFGNIILATSYLKLFDYLNSGEQVVKGRQADVSCIERRTSSQYMGDWTTLTPKYAGYIVFVVKIDSQEIQNAVKVEVMPIISSPYYPEKCKPILISSAISVFL